MPGKRSPLTRVQSAHTYGAAFGRHAGVYREAIPGTTMSSFSNSIPFQLACRLRVLNQGTLNAGNTRQNIASLLASCISNANGARTFAKWSVYRAAGTSPLAYLSVKPASVPGYVAPVKS